MSKDKWSTPFKRILAIVLLSTAVSNCAWFGGDVDEQQKREVKNLYLSAKNALRQSNYTESLERYKELESSFPFSPYAEQATVEKAYAHYKNHQYEETVGILDHFIKSNPGYEHLDYVYYLQGLAYYNYARKPLNRILKRDRTDKDPTPLKEGFFTFTELVNKYPNSPYTEDGRMRMKVLRNMLALHEVRIADYYMRRRAYAAVINRCNYVLEHYHGAQHTPEALWLLAEAYKRIGSPKLARDTLQVIELNYPEISKRIGANGEVAEEDQKSWGQNLQDMSDSLLKTLRLKPRY